MTLRAALFDMDGTLLNIDLEGFLSDYFTALGPVVASLIGEKGSPGSAIEAVMAATSAMCAAHPGVLNRDVFNSVFAEKTGVDLGSAEAAAAIDRFYAVTFPTLRKGHGPREGAREAVDAARANGLELVLATNPIFPRAAIVERLAWAGFEPDEFAAITTYETMTACKPFADYYSRAAAMVGAAPDECLMIGDDPVMDASAADAGLRVFYAGPEPVPVCDWSGSMLDAAALIPRLTLPEASE